MNTQELKLPQYLYTANSSTGGHAGDPVIVFRRQFDRNVRSRRGERDLARLKQPHKRPLVVQPRDRTARGAGLALGAAGGDLRLPDTGSPAEGHHGMGPVERAHPAGARGQCRPGGPAPRHPRAGLNGA